MSKSELAKKDPPMIQKQLIPTNCGVPVVTSGIRARSLDTYHNTSSSHVKKTCLTYNAYHVGVSLGATSWPNSSYCKSNFVFYILVPPIKIEFLVLIPHIKQIKVSSPQKHTFPIPCNSFHNQ